MGPMADQFFTPDDVVRKLLSLLRSQREECVVDFAAGNGNLLRAARARWPDCQVIATDTDERQVKALKRAEPSWRTGRCDFLNPRARRACRAIRGAIQAVSLVLLNPPFSCRGNRTYVVRNEANIIRCSKAMAFVLTS